MSTTSRRATAPHKNQITGLSMSALLRYASLFGEKGGGNGGGHHMVQRNVRRRTLDFASPRRAQGTSGVSNCAEGLLRGARDGAVISGTSSTFSTSRGFAQHLGHNIWENLLMKKQLCSVYGLLAHQRPCVPREKSGELQLRRQTVFRDLLPPRLLLLSFPSVHPHAAHPEERGHGT